LKAHNIVHLQVNTGFYLAIATQAIKLLFKDVMKELDRNATSNDQDVFNLVYTRYGYREKFLQLSKIYFANGKDFIEHKLHLKYNIRPFVVRFNYHVGAVAKKQALVDNGYWYI
jgi:hypothetical protein